MTDSVEAPIRYVIAGEKAVFYPADRERSYWPVDEHRVSIGDMRARAADLALERNEFVLLSQPSAVTDFNDTAQVRSICPRHRWYYAPRMQPTEILAFKLFDSDRTRVQWTGHTAFDDPTADKDAPPRESIEIRTISFMAAER